MSKKERIFLQADKKNTAHQRTGSTGSAAGILVDSCTCIHPLCSDSHADTGGFHHTRPYLSGTNTTMWLMDYFCCCEYDVIIDEHIFRPSQVCPAESNENPRWQSQLKLPGVFWQTPLEPHKLGSDEHSLLSTQRGDNDHKRLGLEMWQKSWLWSWHFKNSCLKKQGRSQKDCWQN